MFEIPKLYGSACSYAVKNEESSLTNSDSYNNKPLSLRPSNRKTMNKGGMRGKNEDAYTYCFLHIIGLAALHSGTSLSQSSQLFWVQKLTHVSMFGPTLPSLVSSSPFRKAKISGSLG